MLASSPSQSTILRLRRRAKTLVATFGTQFLEEDDLLQETLKKAHQAKENFRGNTKGELTNWLICILESTAFDFFRQRKAQKNHFIREEVSLSNLESDDKSPSSIVGGLERKEWLRNAITRMPERYRDVLLLRYQENCTFEDIAVRLGRNMETVKKQWLRGLRWLKDEEDWNAL